VIDGQQLVSNVGKKKQSMWDTGGNVSQQQVREGGGISWTLLGKAGQGRARCHMEGSVSKQQVRPGG
jgi:hypothetical protein